MGQPDNRTVGSVAAHAPGETESTTSPARRLIGAVASPNETFKEINRKPTWVAPIIIAVLTVMAGNAFYYWRVKPDWEQLVLARIVQHRTTTGEVMSPAQVEQQITFAKMMGRFFIPLPVITVPVFCLTMAGVYMLGFGMGFLATPPFKKILSIVAWSEAANRAVAVLTLIIVLIATDKEKLQGFDPTQSRLVQSNLSVFLPANTSAPLKSLAASLDIFTIWFLILLTVGFANIAEEGSQSITAWKAGVLVFGMWAAWVLTKAGLALWFGY
jgi:hypothetical protein